MSWRLVAAAAALALGASACQQIPDKMTAAEFCANPDNANKDVCKINVEIDGQKQALAQTNVSLSQARQIAEDAVRRANAAQSSADQAMQTATAAAQRDTSLNCETRTVQRAKSGACAPGYKLLSCTQTRFTYKAGGPSILRQVNDEGCTFQERVLEMQVRCCAVGPVTAEPTQTSVPAAPTAPETPAQSS